MTKSSQKNQKHNKTLEFKILSNMSRNKKEF